MRLLDLYFAFIKTSDGGDDKVCSYRPICRIPGVRRIADLGSATHRARVNYPTLEGRVVNK